MGGKRGDETKVLNEDELEKIKQILDDKAPELSDDFQNARRMNTELFQWSSAAFLNQDEDHANASK